MFKRILAFVFVAMLVMASVGVAQVGYRDSVTGSQPTEMIDNESWTVSTGVNTLERSNEQLVYGEAVTVTQGSTTYEEEGNYTWHKHNGTISVPSSTDLTTGSSAEIDYNVSKPTNEQVLMQDLMLLLPTSFGDELPTILMVAILLGAVVMMARSGGY